MNEKALYFWLLLGGIGLSVAIIPDDFLKRIRLPIGVCLFLLAIFFAFMLRPR